MKVTLIDPPALGLSDPSAYSPMGLMYLAAVLEKTCDVEIVDFSNLTEEEAITRAVTVASDYVGITSMSAGTFNIVQKIARVVRAEYRAVVVGGAFATSAYKEFDRKYIDYMVLGEGELSLSGILYKTIGCCSVKNLDDLPFPARHLVKRERIQYKGSIHLSKGYSTTVFASRGCPYSCSFCDTEMWGKKYRTRSPQNVAEEIEMLKKDYQITNIRFPDDSFTINRTWAIKMCEELKKLAVTWVTLSRSDGVDKELLEIMKDAGCIGLFFGIESGSQKILDRMNKQTTVEKNKEAIRLCREVGIKSSAYMMFGFPGEVADTVGETKRFLAETRPDRSHFSTFIPLHGSDVMKNPEKYNLKVKNNYYDYWYYDNHDFAFDPGWINEKELYSLREDLTRFYQKEGYDRWDGK